jgi:glutaredoxin
MINATLYTRPGCHLCGMLKAKLRWVARDIPLRFDEVDVSGDPELERQYGQRIPVMVVDGVELVEGVVSDEELRKRLGGRK